MPVDIKILTGFFIYPFIVIDADNKRAFAQKDGRSARQPLGEIKK